ncbi:hypothetical protein [Clostridium sp. BJN0013]|uniref:hypothetical protein n=1 Tax=Clostridium sp. BJN0013 TaxID=3236840 RepID=UPI0034C69D22
MNKSINSHVFLIVKLICLIIVGAFINHITQVAKNNLDVFLVPFSISLLSIAFSFLLNIENFIRQIKLHGVIKWNIPKITLAVILIIIFILYILEYFKILTPFNFIAILTTQYSYLFIFFGILLGYTLTELFIKESNY